MQLYLCGLICLMYHIPFTTINWSTIEKTQHQGQTGIATWQTIELSGLRIRLVEYSKEYVANHWCQKGHIVYCLEGEFTSRLETGEEHRLSQGMSYLVSDDASSHLSVTENGVKLLIIDGDFLRGLPL